MSESGEESKSHRSKCRNAECGKTFSTRSNRDRHEKKVGHNPAQRRNSIQVPIFNRLERVLLSKLSGHVKIQ